MSSKNDREAGWRPVRRGPAAWSLAARLTAWYTLSSFTLLAVGTGFLYWALVTNLDREDDATLADKVLALRDALRDWPADGTALRQEVGEGGAHQQAPVYVRILGEGGAVIAQTPGMADALPRDAFPPPGGPEARPGPAADFRSDAGRSFRVVAARAQPRAGTPAVVLQLALDHTQEEDILADYRRNLWLVLAAGLVLCAGAGYWIARRGLGPLRTITGTARRIRPANLGERLATAGLPAELGDLADTFNGMLGRLEESFGRLSRFSADIAHELRTPVNNLRGEVEVALGKPRPPDEYREVLGSCLEECGRLSRMIDALLFLARAENPRTQVEREPVDVAQELRALREFYEPAAGEAGVCLTVAAPDGVRVELCRPLLQRAVGNLVENALAHTPAGGRVTLSAAPEKDGVRIEVVDTGRGIEAPHLPRLFDRFYRVDPARSSASGGVGLGLAIVKSVAELHGGSVAVASQVGEGTRVTLLLPRPGAPGMPDDKTVISPS
jgi:two-component system heavy metal sensor histidine kinase CusS